MVEDAAAQDDVEGSEIGLWELADISPQKGQPVQLQDSFGEEPRVWRSAATALGSTPPMRTPQPWR